MLRLYDYWRSSAAYRTRIGLNLKGLAYDQVQIDLNPKVREQLGTDYRAKNPQARVPMLETDGLAITQSLAILEWLDETYPGPAFLPGDAFSRAAIRAFALTIACDIHPINNQATLVRLEQQFGASEAAKDEWYRYWIALGFSALEAQAANRPQGAFAFGAGPTLADICLVPQMYNARRFELDLAPFPRLSAIDANARAHPAFAAAAPEQQKRPA